MYIHIHQSACKYMFIESVNIIGEAAGCVREQNIKLTSVCICFSIHHHLPCVLPVYSEGFVDTKEKLEPIAVAVKKALENKRKT